MQEAQKMQRELMKKQEEIEKTNYEGKSSLVDVTLNGKKEVVKININLEEDIKLEDKEMLEDMIMLAFNEASKKVDADIETKLGSYGKGIPGLF